MQIKRDYSQPFFSTRRRRRNTGRTLFIFGLLMGGFLVFFFTQFSRLQLMALDAVGMAPTPTPFASWYAEQGYNYYLQGKLESAASAFAQAVNQQPDNINYLYEYGRLLIELDRQADTSLGRSLSDAELASQLGDQAITAAPNDVRSFTLKAKALVWMSDSASAIPIALRGIEIDPNFAPLLAVLARAYTDIGRYQQGLDYGFNAVEADPMNADAHRSYAIALIWVGERDAAIRELEDAININPNLTTPYFELAGQYVGASMYEEAVATYERILTMEPRNAKALLRMCEVYSRIGQDEQGQGYCDDALTIDPNYAQAYRQLGMVNFRRRNYEGAIENFLKCVDLESEEIECYYLRGLAHFYLNECDPAWEVLTDSLRRIELLPVKEPVLSTTQEGLRLVTQYCPAYSNQAVPTPVTPTPLPTPIGLGGGG
ncbi:MAG: tetratricopeptide repeat protein [Anaerolineae bacterium]|nr:tetratricopeptide repeat protein [Anaerolineae bacterium]